MSASSKFDLSSNSPDRPLYTSGQRGSYSAASLDRSGSFRENTEMPILPAIPNMSRGSSAATQDVMSFFQCLRFDPKSMVTTLKLNRPVDFKRLASVSFGIPLEDPSSAPAKGKPVSSPSPEEFRRLKTSVREGCRKARERVKIFNESLSVMNKWFPTIQSRKRSRSDSFSSDRSNTLYSADRSVSATGISKMGAQSHVGANGFDVEQKSEERTKNSVPNKRTRTSMVDPRADARANTLARPSGTADRDREILKIPSSSAVQSEDRPSPLGVDGWEKSKMKKKRSGIKPDVAASSSAAKPMDGSRDFKQGMQPRLLADARSRLSESHGFRPVANGGMSKVDGSSQQSSSGTRSSISRLEQDNSPLLHDKRDRPTDKEKVNMKAINKTSAREDFSSGSPTSSTKLNATRGPRSGSSVGQKLSPVVSHATAANDWEVSQCTSKIPAAVGVNSRKRTPSMRSSSPPVAQWASQRPQKISRTARRSNFIPIVQSTDETSALDTASADTGNERRLSGSSPQQVKLKGDHFSSAALSESEESGPPSEMKFKDKMKKSDGMEEKAGQNVQKMSNLMLPPRKKIISGDDHGDGIRRQGRTGRGFTSTRSLMPLTVEKLGNVRTAKQLRSARLGFDKTESKAGRPPTRKLSDRKAYTRQKHSAVSLATDFIVGSDDGHEVLLAAANAVPNPAPALSSSFWKQMEPLFRFVSDADVAYLKQKVEFEPTTVSPMAASSGMVNPSSVSNGFGGNEIERGFKRQYSEDTQEHLSSATKTLEDVSLYQRLISALIPEGDEQFCHNENEDIRFDGYESGFEPETNVKSDSFCSQLSQNSDLSGNPASNGFRISANGGSFNELKHIMPDNSSLSIPDTRIPSYRNSQNGFPPDQALTPGVNCTEGQYSSMSINERLLLEIHCIGIFPEFAPDSANSGNEEISTEISKLNEIYYEQVSKRKGLVSRLLKSAVDTRELQDREFEQHALNKLVVMAYEKYMTCCGPNAHGMKSANGKMAKHAALAFVKRTLERCQEYQETGKSCFNEPLFRDIFVSGCSQLGDVQAMDSIADGESGKHEVRPSASTCAEQSPSSTNHDMFSDNLLSANLASEQISGKEETWSNRVKKKELSLDDVGGGAIAMSPAVTPGIGSSFSSGTKGKRSERDREGKGSSREVISRSGTTKTGRPTSAKGERKSKTKPKQKTAQLSASVNGLLGKMSEKPKVTVPSTQKTSNTSSSGMVKDKNDYGLDELEDPIDLSGLQIPEMDDLGVADDFGGQGQDIGSWLNIDDDALQDHDFMGLEIPMDDLSELNMMV
ncbi:uncharacterized protein [Coffea arabica]|uniref:Uncharacterized protein isoform X1 n=1 Tax=Coffea arabica TaxID=13443 RepID=A0ABM4UV35_COFAR